MINRIVSGGQTGVDRGALDAAMALGIPAGGWCPLGRKAEDGTIPSQYPVRETDSPDYSVRTRRNVYTSDVTLIVTQLPEITGGTLLTRDFAILYSKPVLVQTISAPYDIEPALAWLAFTKPDILNLAGPRESEDPGIQSSSKSYLIDLIDQVRAAS